MSLRFHEIAENGHRILNPYSEEKYRLLGEVCGLERDRSVLDLACGRGEMLCRWAERHGIHGTGVDISEVFFSGAQARARELEVEDRVHFVRGEARDFVRSCNEHFDVVSCIGATWIGGGLVGTLREMKKAMRGPESLLLVGEPFWNDEPPEAAVVPLSSTPGMYVSLAETLERFESEGLELIEMLLADLDGWDRYEASQWKSVSDWLRAHPDDPEAAELRAWSEANRKRYLEYGRRYLGWGVFMLRAAG
jgi:SAM-dependent methyltransferase